MPQHAAAQEFFSKGPHMLGRARPNSLQFVEGVMLGVTTIVRLWLSAISAVV